MPLSRVEERRWFSRVLLTRLPHISLYPHSLHVRPSRHISTLHPLNIHLPRLLFLTFHLLPLPSPLPPPLISSSSPHFPSSRRAFLLVSTSITFTPPRSLNLLYPHLSPSSSLVFSRCFHSFRKFSPSYALICNCIKEALTLLICREQNHFKLFSKFLTAGALTGAQALKWST